MRFGGLMTFACAIGCLVAAAAPAAALDAVHGTPGSAPLWVVSAAEDETAKRAWLGVSITDITDEAREEHGIAEGVAGALVLDVYDESPAAAAGIREGDVITSLGGKKVKDVGDLVSAVGDSEPGAVCPVVLLRDGKETSLEIALGEREKDEFRWIGDLESLKGLEALKNLKIDLDVPSLELGLSGYFGRGRLGVYIDDLSEGLAGYFDVPGGKGVLVEDVVEGGPAQKGGIKAGDVILKLGGRSVEDSGELREAIADVEPGKETPVVVWRKGKETALAVVLEESEEAAARRAYIKALGDEGDARVIVREFQDEKSELEDELDNLRQELKELKEEIRELKSGQE